MARHLRAQAATSREHVQIGAIEDNTGHIETFQMDGVGTPIIRRPRLLPSHDTPTPARNTYTLNYEEPPRLFAFWGVGVVFEASRGLWTVSWDDDRTQEFALGASSTKTRT